MKIIFNDGTNLEVLGVQGGSTIYQGLQRDSITFILDPEKYTLTQVNDAFTVDKCSKITLENIGPASPEPMYYVHEDYILRVSISIELSPESINNPNEPVPRSVINVKMAQLTYTEKQLYQTQQAIIFISEAVNVDLTIQLTFKEKRLKENSDICTKIIENEFKSNIKGNGLQPYRMNRDDQDNLSGIVGMINTMLVTGVNPETIRTFSWQNANQLECDDDWTYEQILGLVKSFGTWKEVILKRQNLYKKEITNAKTDEELENINLNYGDLLVFD